jgi:tetratricopeptide (TPR) repeat protein
MDADVPTSQRLTPSSARRGMRWWVLRLAGAAVLCYLGWSLAVWAWGSYHLRAARRDIQQREFDRALDRLAVCRTVWPDDGEIWLLSARTARRAGHFQDADNLLLPARKRGARQRDLVLEQVLLTAQRGQYAEVEPFLTERLTPELADFPLVAEVVSAEWMRTYRLAEARALLTHWLAKEPDEVGALVRRGWVAEHQLDFDAAVNDYRRVLNLSPGQDSIRLRLVEILLKIRRPEEAAPYAAEAYRHNPTDAAAVLAAARCWREIGQLDEARAALAGMTDQQRQTPAVQAERAHLALQAGEAAEAEILFRTALRSLPRERAVLYGLQQALSRQGKTAEAEKTATALAQVDQDGRRMNKLMTILATQPGNADLRHECGVIFLRNGLEEDGLRWLAMALESDPRHRPTHAQLAEYFDRNGQPERAAPHRKALERLPPAKKGEE